MSTPERNAMIAERRTLVSCRAADAAAALNSGTQITADLAACKEQRDRYRDGGFEDQWRT